MATGLLPIMTSCIVSDTEPTRVSSCLADLWDASYVSLRDSRFKIRTGFKSMPY